MSTRLSGHRALVTGSTSGIGRAIADAFAAEGAFVVVTGRREQLGGEVAAGIRERGGAAAYVAADLSGGSETIDAFADAAAATAGGYIDILVNNAAYIVPPQSTSEASEDVIDAVLALNIKAPYQVTAALVPAMIVNGGGTVINIGSINAATGLTGSALYTATKGALHALTSAWAAEFGRSGVRVNAIAPGPTAVEWNEPIRDALDQLVSGTPSGRVSLAAEVAAAAVFLASDESSNVHGITLPVDGGLLAVQLAATA